MFDTIEFTTKTNLLLKKKETVKLKKKTFIDFLINNLLFVSGFVMLFSGFVMQIGFHMGGSENQFALRNLRIA